MASCVSDDDFEIKDLTDSTEWTKTSDTYSNDVLPDCSVTPPGDDGK